MERIQIWTNDSRTEYAICMKGDDAVMRHTTMDGILYPNLVDEYRYSSETANTLEEELTAWIKRERR